MHCELSQSKGQLQTTKGHIKSAIRGELENKKKINYEQLKFQLQQEKELQEVMIMKEQAEEWLKKKEAKKTLIEKYGKDTKVHKALIKDLVSLHTITSIHKLNLIHDFYNDGKIGNSAKCGVHINGQTRPCVRGPEENEASGKQDWKKRGRWGDREKLLFGNDGERNKKKQCIYCESKEHTAINCTKILDVAKRREILKQKNSCYNCATPDH
ncbi:Hypothetical predicted protein [Paramuricea clavata]|uniref:Uncharacterized protein n=1 Tax=Paramuricea clavata TaxID=317549 RepID=A0A6S7K4C1_PARCT|nr:Hypothetical predicted protein [Paramuricea clavata]